MHSHYSHSHSHSAFGRAADMVVAPRGLTSELNALANATVQELSPYAHGLTGVDQTANYLFAAVLCVSLGGLCVLTLLFRWATMGNAHMRHLLTMSNPDRQVYWAQNHTSIWPKIKKHLLYAPLGRNRHNKEIQLSSAISIGTLPSRFHTLLLSVYLLSNVAYCLVLRWGAEDRGAVLAELRGRSGELAALNIIPTMLFAMRNNPLIPLLRVSYDTFNLLHRWCARVCAIESIIHTICYLVNVIDSVGYDGLKDNLATPSYAWGMVGTCAFTMIIIQAFSPLRHAFYETFLNLHRFLVMLGLIGVYVHLEKHNLPQTPYIKFVIILWGLEWLSRFVRVAYFNFSLKSGMSRAHIEALPGEACRVTFELARSWNYIPGSHVHIYFPTVGLWSSHPFSVAWAETKPRSAPLEIEMEKLPSWNMPKHQSVISHYKTQISDSDGPEVTHVSLIIRARSGMTRQLYERACASPNGIITLPGVMEGPYGGHEKLASYGTAVLFAGGVGITHCVGYVHRLLTQYSQGTCSTRRILLVWSVPTTEALEWARPWMDQILKMEGRKEVLRVQLFVTKPRNQNEVNSRTGTVQMFPGRCNPSTVLEKEVAEQVGAMGVVVCGPGAFADSVRAAVRKKVDVGNITFHEEAFTY
jgi:predicted ferric reductase